jgi:hypothetical protein
MRILALALALVALAVLPTTASAKEGIELSSLPNFLSAGQPWVVEVHSLPFPGTPALPSNAPVGVQISSGGRTLRFPATALAGGGYRARVVFPSAGRWSYKVVGIGRIRQQNWAPVDIGPAPRRTATTESSGFPAGWVGAGAAIAVALGLLFVRRQRT